MENHKKLIILGSGPAGYAASIYAARAGLNPALIAGSQEGGQLTTTTDVENWPGDSDGLQGPELMERMKNHALQFDVEMIADHIDTVDLSKKPFILNGNNSYSADALIISTGATAMYLGLPSEQKFLGKGVSACATCDGFFYKDKKVLVVGGGDSAMEESNYLTKFASEVVIVHRRDEFRASKIMIDRALNNSKISIRWNNTIDEILGDRENGVNSVMLRDTISGELKKESCDGVFMAIGHKPNTDLLDNVIDTDEFGYIITKNGSTATNLDGIFACGDVQDKIYRQAVTAAGSGCMSAIDVEHYLESLKK